MSFTRRPATAVGILVAALFITILVFAVTACAATSNEHGDRQPESGLVIDYPSPSPVAVCPDLEGDNQ